jgi:hypothetical protein
MKTKQIYLALIVTLIAMSGSLWAHHGTGVSYDTSKQITVQAVVTEFHYVNPHPSIFFDVKDDKGNVVHWSGEIAPNAAQLQQDGWGKKRSIAALMTGAPVSITIAPSRAGTPVGLILKIVGPTGENILGMNGNAFQPAPPAGGNSKQ